MLVALAFRRIGFYKNPAALDKFLYYLLQLKQNYSLVLPGEPISRHAIILTFDHASAELYHHVFPFLQQHKIPAVIGIAWRYVAAESATSLPLSWRCYPTHTLAFQDEIFTKYYPFCSTQELLTMARSPYIHLASSGFAIRNLKFSPHYLDTEVILSKQLISSHLGVTPKSFFYPFGKYDYNAAQSVHEHYSYSFVLGNTINRSSKCHEIYRLEISSIHHMPSVFHSITYLNNWLKERYNQIKLKKSCRSRFF